MSTDDRRTPGTARVPLEGLVEVGEASGSAFEAQAVNVSEEGLQIRSAYVPEPGEQLSCRFDVPGGQSVMAAGEVAWAHGSEQGGEVGIRFTEMDPESIDALKRACGQPAEASPSAPAGAKIRLHIEGLASPMRAKIRDSRTNEVTVGSELGFLQVGKELVLEDPSSRAKRAAFIDSVEVAIDPATRVPQLIVTLRYADAASNEASAPAAAQADEPVAASPPEPPRAREGDSDDAAPTPGERRPGGVAGGVAQIGQALEKLANQARTTIALLAKGERSGAEPPKRTTAPAPGGGLHTSGRRVVRGEPGSQAAGPQPRITLPKRRAAIAAAVMVAAVGGALVLKGVRHEAPRAATEADPTGGAASALAAGPASAAVLATQAPPAASAAEPSPSPATPSQGSAVAADEGADVDAKVAHKKAVRVAPFGNGPVHHGTMIQLKMDGTIESLEGAQQPTGFVVKIPGRKSLEPASPLAARDSRIAAMKVTNGATGAELTVVFKDGVPMYRVSAHGDTLVIALAVPGPTAEQTVASRDEVGGSSPKRAKASRDKDADRRAPLPRLPASGSRTDL
jgi:PilZ domain